MKFTILINQKRIIELGLNESNATPDTWALLDFLGYFQNAKTLRKINTIEGEFIWINYKYIQEQMPLYNFNNRNLKKHLDILTELKLIQIYKDENNSVYFKFLSKYADLFADDTASAKIDNLVQKCTTPNANLHHPLVQKCTKEYINNQEDKNNKNLKEDNKERDNKEVIMQNENENQKENTLSWKEKAINLFDEYKITNFSKELWVKWIERKHEKHKETNLMSYDIDIQRLIRAKENANETLEINIAGGWKTIYTKTEQKQTSNNRYKGTCNDHEVRANWHKGDSDKTARDIITIIERDLGKFDDSPSVENNSEELKNDETYNNDNDLPF